jgi:hypothetical protein
VPVVALLVFLAVPCGAQSFYGGISGTVMDSSGAVIPGATVTVVNAGTNETHKTESNAIGEFRFVNLVPANYKLIAEAATFKLFEQQPVVVQVNATVQIDVHLEAGAADETVQVTSEAPLLQTESGTVGAAVEGQVVQNMPLNGRNPMNLIGLAPGVVAGQNTSGSSSFNAVNRTSIGSWNSYQIAGGFNNENSEYIDGTPINMLGGNTLSLVPAQDAIQEFRVDASAASPEFGRYGGGVISMTTKSGSNGFHGTVYEYVRNTVLNANYFFSNAAGLPKAPFHQNQYGGALGGPIKKDKFFFFAHFEKFKLRAATPTSTNVPGDGNNGTVNNRGGVFATPIADPVFTASGGTSGCNVQSDSAAGTYTIPTSCFDTTSQVMMGYFPGTNQNPATHNSYNYSAQPVVGDDTLQVNGRLDYTINEKQRVFARFTRYELDDIGADEFGKNATFSTIYAASHNLTHQIVVGDTYSISPVTVLDGRLSYTRQLFTNPTSQLNKVDLSEFGPAYDALASQVSYRALPSMALQGTHNIYNLNPISGVEFDHFDNYSANGSLTRIIGSHTIKAGGEAVLRLHNGTGYFRMPSGYSIFQSAMTAVSGVQGSGDEIASFLLGEFYSDVIQTIQPSTTFNYSYALYALDTWRVNHGLTVNLGIRWELPGGIMEKKDRATVFLPDAMDPITGYKGALVLVKSSLYGSRSVEPIHHNFFGPRVSFAQTLRGDAVLRGGYGLAYLPPDMPPGLMAFTNPLNAGVTTALNGSVPTHFQSDPFSGGIIQPTQRSNFSAFALRQLNQTVTAVVPTSNYPYMQQWNLSLGKQWKGAWSTELSYVGTKGTKLPMNVSMGLNQIATSDAAILQSYEATQAGCVPPAPCSSAAQSATVAYAKTQGMIPYPQYSNLYNAADYSGGSTYSAMYLVLQKRFKQAGLLNANFTWDKMLSDTDSPSGGNTSTGGTEAPQDYYNRKAEKSLAFTEIEKRLVVNYVLHLPVGKGQTFWSGAHGVVGALISGWAANGITVIQSGLPIAIAYNGSPLTKNLNAGILRPNYVKGCGKMAGVPAKPFDRWKSQNWFNAACFAYPGDFSWGDEPRVDPLLRAPGQVNFDFSLSKATAIRDGLELQFRAEAFNLFNHPYFGAPNGTMAGSGYNDIPQQGNPMAPRLLQLSLRLNY